MRRIPHGADAESLNLLLTVTPGSTPALVDAYVFIRLPDGTVLSKVPVPPLAIMFRHFRLLAPIRTSLLLTWSHDSWAAFWAAPTGLAP